MGKQCGLKQIYDRDKERIAAYNIVPRFNENVGDISEEIDVRMAEFRVVHKNFVGITYSKDEGE